MNVAHPATALALAPTLEALPMAPRRALERLATLGFQHVQLSARQDGLRPRDLDRSARRDLAATLRRQELEVSGIDLWIPPTHFLDVRRVDRAIALAQETIEMAEDLGRCPVSCTMPGPDTPPEIARALLEPAAQRGVRIADHTLPPFADADVGVDPAACLAIGDDPVAAVTQAGAPSRVGALSDLLTTGMRGPIGGAEPRLDVTGYRVAISVAGYSRAVVVDARQWSDPWGGLQQTREVWG